MLLLLLTVVYERYLQIIGFWKFVACFKSRYLIIQCYAPGHSRFISIEPSWSYQTKWLVEVILPVEILELEFTIPKEKENEKWNTVLDNAVKDCTKFWKGKNCEDFPVTATPFLSSDDRVGRFKMNHKILNSVSNSCNKKIA